MCVCVYVCVCVCVDCDTKICPQESTKKALPPFSQVAEQRARLEAWSQELEAQAQLNSQRMQAVAEKEAVCEEHETRWGYEEDRWWTLYALHVYVVCM